MKMRQRKISEKDKQRAIKLFKEGKSVFFVAALLKISVPTAMNIKSKMLGGQKKTPVKISPDENEMINLLLPIIAQSEAMIENIKKGTPYCHHIGLIYDLIEELKELHPIISE